MKRPYFILTKLELYSLSVYIAKASNIVKKSNSKSAETENILKSLFKCSMVLEHVSLVDQLVVTDLVPGVFLDVVHVEEHETHGETDQGKDVSEDKSGHNIAFLLAGFLVSSSVVILGWGFETD